MTAELIQELRILSTTHTSEINDFADKLRSSFFLLAIILRSANFLTSDTRNIDEVRATRNAKSARKELICRYFPTIFGVFTSE